MLRVMRRGDRHDPKDLTIALRFEGNFGAAFKDGDPSGLLPGEAIKNLVHRVARGQEHAAIEELGQITGQQPVRRKAKKSIANYGLREGQEIGASVTLRGARMWEFLDRFVSVALPRVRDFRGVSTKSFDGRGNYSLGVKEQLIFPEINYDAIESTHGMDITFVTTAPGDDLALALLKELGMPFRGNDKTGARI